ncbi:hypothetical protein ANN_02270 [Periplaneta americana]|uniref:Uncharacterized protein n=1 Tax=Periplaneta americana TaxID=6978 RepID=A0ABQ8TVX6_PERAM|nr:hypothetical protein ANN_02270 [Periplaneta americana]
MAGLCEGGNEPSVSLKAICKTDRLDTATCTHTLLSTDVHIRTDHVRYTFRYLHCFSVVSCPHPSNSALNGILPKTAYTVIVATVRSKNMFAFSSDERAFNIESFSHSLSVFENKVLRKICEGEFMSVRGKSDLPVTSRMELFEVLRNKE